MWPLILDTKDFVLPTYLLVNSLVFSLGIIWIYKRAEVAKLNQSRVLDVALAAMIGSFLGSKSFHIFFEQPEFYFKNPSMIFQLWYGGFVFYGGLGGGLLAAYLMSRRRQLRMPELLDLSAPVLAAGYAIGRLGCLAAGCCYGKPTDSFLAIFYPSGAEAPHGMGLHPTPIYSTLWETFVCVFLITLEKRQTLNHQGQLFGVWLILHGLGRGVIEQFRGDFRGNPFLNLSVSTWLSLVAIAFGIWLLRKKEQNASTTISTRDL